MGHLVLPGVAGGPGSFFDPPFAETAGNQDSAEILEQTFAARLFHLLSLDVLDLDLAVVTTPPCFKASYTDSIGVLKFDVL